MLKQLTFAIITMLGISGMALAAEAEITGNVQSKCVIYTSSPGIYGNPTADVLSTDANNGGTPAIIRYDVAQANYYKAVISTPTNFTTSPALDDTLAWTGSVGVNEVTDAAMSAYDTNKRVYGEVTEVDLTVAGTVWFKASSTVSYGAGKALPGGTYKAVVVAECIAL
jgi:hypothetical protein